MKTSASGAILVTVTSANEVGRELVLFEGMAHDNVALGTQGDWRLEGSGLGSLHAFLKFDGNELSIAAATDQCRVEVNGSAVAKGWQKIVLPAKVCLGSGTWLRVVRLDHRPTASPGLRDVPTTGVFGAREESGRSSSRPPPPPPPPARRPPVPTETAATSEPPVRGTLESLPTMNDAALRATLDQIAKERSGHTPPQPLSPRPARGEGMAHDTGHTPLPTTFSSSESDAKALPPVGSTPSASDRADWRTKASHLLTASPLRTAFSSFAIASFVLFLALGLLGSKRSPQAGSASQASLASPATQAAPAPSSPKGSATIGTNLKKTPASASPRPNTMAMPSASSAAPTSDGPHAKSVPSATTEAMRLASTPPVPTPTERTERVSLLETEGSPSAGDLPSAALSGPPPTEPTLPQGNVVPTEPGTPKDVRPDALTLQRKAVDYLATGAYEQAAQVYDELARRSPGGNIFRDAARVLRESHGP